MKRVPKVLLFGYFSNCDIYPLKFHIKDGFSFNFPSLQKCLTNEFFNFETMTLCHSALQITAGQRSMTVNK